MSTQINYTKGNYAIPVAIVIAGALIAGSLFLALSKSSSQTNTAGSPDAAEAQVNLEKINKVTNKDHIKGNPDAKLKIVEYSDFECPFCQRFHGVMNKIIQEYGPKGEVAWVYRHFPLEQLHPRNARKAAIASECVAKLGGNDAFWKFTDEYFRTTPSNDQWNIDDELERLVAFAGVDKKAFDSCYTSGEFDKDVQEDFTNAVETGGRGTPWSIVLLDGKPVAPINGAQPYEAVKSIIDSALSK